MGIVKASMGGNLSPSSIPDPSTEVNPVTIEVSDGKAPSPNKFHLQASPADPFAELAT